MNKRVNFGAATIEFAIEHGLVSRTDAANSIRDFDKPAGDRCKYQKHHVGCSIYRHRPLGCRFWNCRWLVNDDTADLSRPDRSHYVIDISPDYVTIDGKNVQVVQIWCDPGYPDAHRDPALRRYLERRAAEGIAALVRYNELDALFLVAPALSNDGQWHERPPNQTNAVSHSPLDKLLALGAMQIKMSPSS